VGQEPTGLQGMAFAHWFELFRDDPIEPVSIAAFDDLHVAKEAMRGIASSMPGGYLVWIPSEGQIVAQVLSASNSFATSSKPEGAVEISSEVAEK
jgi:hypothetical protein